MRRNLLLVAAIEIVFLVALAGCGTIEPLSPSDTGATEDAAMDEDAGGPLDAGVPVETVSFANQVAPIFEQRCIQCHYVATKPNDKPAHPTLAPEVAYQALTGGGTLSCNANYPYVVPGDPESSGLMEKLGERPACGVPMPRGSRGLCVVAPGQCEAIRRWIAEGAEDN